MSITFDSYESLMQFVRSQPSKEVDYICPETIEVLVDIGMISKNTLTIADQIVDKLQLLVQQQKDEAQRAMVNLPSFDQQLVDIIKEGFEKSVNKIDFLQACAPNHKIHQIKLYRAVTGCNLREARDFVESYLVTPDIPFG